MGVLGRRQQGLSTQEAQQRRKNQDIISEQGSHFLAAQLQNNTQDVHPYTRCLPRSDFHSRLTSMKPTNNSSTCKSNSRETPACPVVTYLSIVSVFSLIMLTNFQHSPTLPPQTP